MIFLIACDTLNLHERYLTMKFSENLKQIRIKKGFSQKEIADRLGVSQPSYAQYENGKRNPKKETIKKMADALEVPIQELDASLQNMEKLLELVKLKNSMLEIQKEHENDNREGMEEIKNVLQMTIDDLNIEINKEQQVLDQEAEWMIEIERIYISLPHEAKETLRNIINQFSYLNEDGRAILLEQMELLLKVPEYKNDNNSEN